MLCKVQDIGSKMSAKEPLQTMAIRRENIDDPLIVIYDNLSDGKLNVLKKRQKEKHTQI